MPSYELPSKERLREIAACQDEKEREIEEARAREQSRQDRESAAARIIQVGRQRSPTSHTPAEPAQRNYRGYRERRELQGFGLSPAARWTEVCVP